MSNQIAALVARLEAAKRTYYQHTNELVISDAEYDALEDQLRVLDPGNAFFSKVGAAPTGGAWPKVKHSTPMGSLNKAQETKDLRDWVAGLPGKPSFLVSDKCDGISLNLRYEKRRLVQGLTRGDGITGEDITRNVMMMQGVVKLLPATLPDGSPTPDLVFVRGEVLVLHGDFKAHFIGDSNPRNSASGTSKRQTGADKCRYLTVKTYQYLPNGMATLPTKEDEFRALEAAGFLTPRWSVCKTPAEVEAVYEEYVKTTRASLDYDIDGLVIDINDTAAREFMGEHNGKPKGATAFKFPHEEQPSILRNIRWQVGNSGRITPVAEFDTVNLAGANVKQASLHNISNIEDLASAVGRKHLLNGDEILVARRNDVIPMVEAVLKSAPPMAPFFGIPDKCPACGTTLERDGEYLVCRGEDCSAQVAGMIKRWVKKIGVLHVGDSLIEALIEAKLIEDIADLYLLDPSEAEDIDVGGRRAGGTATKAIKNLEAKKALPLHTFIGALGIPLIGRTMAKTIVDGGVNSLSKMAKVTSAEVAAIPGVGDTKAKAFVQGFNERLGLIGKLLGAAGITIQSVSGPLVGQSFCFTNFRDSALETAIEKAGGTMKSGVSKDLTYLVDADPSTVTGKAQKAAQYGTKVIGVDEARKMAGV